MLDRQDVLELKREAVDRLAARGIHMRRDHDDRDDDPNNYRFLGQLLRAAKDLEIALEDFAKGSVRVQGCACRGSWRFAKKRWRMPEQGDPMAFWKW